MGNPIYSTRNRLLDAESVQMRNASNLEVDHPEFPASNLYDQRVGTVARARGTFRARVRVAFGLTAAQSIGVVGLFNHNLPADADVRLYSTNIDGVWNEVVNLSAHLGNETFAVTFTAQTRMFWLLDILSLGTATEPFQLGELWLGAATQLSRNVEWGGSIGVDYRNVSVSAFSGHETSYHVSESRLYEGEAPRGLTSAQRDEFVALYRATKGGAAPFLFKPDGDLPEAWIAKLRDPRYAPKSMGPGRFEGIPLNIYELPWGRPAV